MPRKPHETRTGALEPAVAAILKEVALLRHSTPPSLWTKSLLRLFKMFDNYELSMRPKPKPKDQPAEKRAAAPPAKRRSSANRAATPERTKVVDLAPSDVDSAHTILPLPKQSRWRKYNLSREAGRAAVRSFAIYERIDADSDPEDPDFRVWCEELIDDEQWWLLEGTLEESNIRVFFPHDLYNGMPPHLDIEKPMRPRLGGRWRVLRPDRGQHGVYVLKSVEAITATQVALEEKTFRSPERRFQPRP